MLQPSELQRRERYVAVTSQTAQEGEQLTDDVRGGLPARGLVGVGFHPPANLDFSFLLRGLPHRPPSCLAHTLPLGHCLPSKPCLSHDSVSATRVAPWTTGCVPCSEQHIDGGVQWERELIKQISIPISEGLTPVGAPQKGGASHGL